MDENTQRQLDDIKTREEIASLKKRLDDWEARDIGHSLWAAIENIQTQVDSLNVRVGKEVEKINIAVKEATKDNPLPKQGFSFKKWFRSK